MAGVSFFWLRICSSSKKFCSASTPPPQIIKIFNSDSTFTPQNCKFYGNIQACCLKVLLNVRQSLFCLIRQNSARVILPSDEHDWLKWLHDKFGTHHLLSGPWHLQWLSSRCMNEFCHGFSTGMASFWQFLFCIVWTVVQILTTNHEPFHYNLNHCLDILYPVAYLRGAVCPWRQFYGGSTIG